MASAAPSCGIFDLSCHVSSAIDAWFTHLVTSAVNPLFALLGRTLLSTPQIGSSGTVRSLWEGPLAIADTGYVLLVLAGGIMVMGHHSVQASYAAKDIAPRIVTGFLASNLSLLVAGRAILLADGLSAALAGQGVTPAGSARILRGLTLRVLTSGGTFFVLLALFAAALVLVLCVIFAARLMLTVLLVAVAPLALACHALPQTDPVARWWWRSFAGVLAIQSAQALVLVAAVRVFLTEQWDLTAIGQPGNISGFDAVQLICLLYILVRIPFWIGRRTWSGGGGRSPIRSAARFAFAAVVLRRITPVLSGRTAAAAGRRPPPGPRPAAAPGPRPLPPGGSGGPGPPPPSPGTSSGGAGPRP